MPSPFPGMNPYLENEDFWHSIHHWFAAAMASAIAPQTGSKYMVTIDANVYLHELPADERRLVGRPDVHITRQPGKQDSAGGAIQAPAYGELPVAVDVEEVPFVQIRDAKSREVVTVIELLSPSNKRPGEDREQYLAKRRQYLRSDTNLIELDLLRGGLRMPVEGLPPCDYCVIVSRADERPRAGIWPLTLRDRLPTIPIPLRAPDADAKLDLQSILNQVYDQSGYNAFLYDAEPQPPLSAEDEAWAKSFISRT